MKLNWPCQVDKPNVAPLPRLHQWGNGAKWYNVCMVNLVFSDAARDGYESVCVDDDAARVIDRILDELEDNPAAVRAQPYAVGAGRMAYLTTRAIGGRNADAVVIWQREGADVRVWAVEVSITPPLP